MSARSRSTRSSASRSCGGCRSAIEAHQLLHGAFPGARRPPRARPHNHGVTESYEIGTGYGHIAITTDDLDATLERLAADGIEPEKPPYRPGGRAEGPRICFVRDPDGYRIEIIETGPPSPPAEQARPNRRPVTA